MLTGWLETRDQLYVVVDPEGKEHLFVDNDIPRDPWVSEELVQHKGFALFDSEGQYIGSYNELEKALRAAATAKTTVFTDTEADVQPDSVIASD
jgi:hypothetical protein